MNIHRDILAKGQNNGSICLYQHLKDVAEIAEVVSEKIGLDKKTAIEGALLHDIGKTNPIFQKYLQTNNSTAIFRHEIASLFFISLVSEDKREMIIDMIAGHHKSVYKDARELGLLDLDDNTNCFAEHSKDFDKWCPIALDILEALGMKTHPISIEEARANYEFAVRYCDANKSDCSIWRGMLMASDHMASAMESKVKIPLNHLFVKPDLSFYNRENSLYPLSQISTDSPKKYTIVTAPTGAGKTDFLLRRCRGRVFYVLPFQASINAMYDRIKKDLSDTDAQVSLLHSASNLKVKDGTLEESIMQRFVGSSVKVMTPHQMASIVFGIKGYESMAIDLKGCDVILDEIHTYSDVIQSIVLHIIDILIALGCRIHIGTATMPSTLYNKIIEIMGGKEKVYEVNLADSTLVSFNRHRIYKLSDFKETFNLINSAIEERNKILIVCNKVKKAQEVYDQVRRLYPNVETMLIHSRFKRKDRVKLESELCNKFNRMNDTPCIVISTQVVEVSLDISFDMMITECAPIDALIQRFGRINRKRSKNNIGHYRPIYVIAPPTSTKEAFPYDLDVLERTYDVLPDNGDLMEENRIQEMIDKVYTDITVTNIDYGGVIFLNGKWRLKKLCHKSKSALLDTLDINSAVAITESDKEKYINGNLDVRMGLEIPVNYKAIAYKRLNQLNDGNCPFVVPDVSYDEEKGLLSDMCRVEFYRSFEII